MTDRNIAEDAARVHGEAVVSDMLIPWRFQTDPQARRRVFEGAVAGGYTYMSLTLGDDQTDLTTAIQIIAAERAFFLANADKYVLVETADDIVRAKNEGKLGIGFHFQGTLPINHNVNMVEVYYKLGVRHMLMAYNLKNMVGDGCLERTDGGLSRFGVQLVEEMNRVGMIVDASHTGHRTTMDMFEVSKDPVIFSHANPRALWDHPRNILDDQIKACAASGGLIGVNGVGVFLGDNDASTEMVLSHVDYLAELVGPEHVGLGTDYIDGAERRALPATGSLFNPREVHEEAHLRASGGTTRGPSWDKIEYFAPEQAPQLSEAMLKRGYSEADVRGVLGENFLRVARGVWK